MEKIMENYWTGPNAETIRLQPRSPSLVTILPNGELRQESFQSLDEALARARELHAADLEEAQRIDQG